MTVKKTSDLIAELTAAGYVVVNLGRGSRRDGAVWGCKIGIRAGTEVTLPAGADGPMRNAIEAAFLEITGLEAEFIFSGWGETLTELENDLLDESKSHSGGET